MRSALGHSATQVLLIRLASQALAFLSIVGLSKYWGADAVGVFALSVAVPALLCLVLAGGLPAAFPHFLIKREHPSSRVLGAGLTWASVVLIANLFALVTIGVIVHQSYFSTLGYLTYSLMFLSATLSYVTEVFEAFIRSHHRVVLAASICLARDAFLVCGLAVFISLSFNSIDAAILALLGSRLSALVYSVLVASQCVKLSVMVDLTLLKLMLRYGSQSQIGNLVNFLNFRLDYLILGSLLASEMLGIYVIATKAAEFIRLVPTTIRYVIEPRLASDAAASARRGVIRATTAVFIICLGVVGVMWWLGPIMFVSLFEDWSAHVDWPFKILLLGTLSFGLTSSISAYNTAHGYPFRNSIAVIFGLVITASLNVIIVPRFGVDGAAIVSTTSYWMSALVLLYLFFQTRKNDVVCEGLVRSGWK